MRQRFPSLLLLLLCAVAAGFHFSALTSEAPSGGTVLLDETAYWRHYFVCGPALVSAGKIQSDGEACLSAKGLERLQKETEIRLKSIGKTGADWMKETAYSYPWRCNGTSNDVVPYLRSEPAPAGWMKPEFDDGEWTCQRFPYLMGRHIGSRVYGSADRNLSVQVICLRGLFEVADPAALKTLTLSLEYRGGARVFLNGKEIARGNLPAGEFPAAVPADDYPAEAYQFVDGEAPPNAKKDFRRIVGDLLPTFDDLEGKGELRVNRTGGQLPVTLNRAAFERIKKLRDRAIGPVSVPAELLRKGSNVLAIEVHASQLHPLCTQWSGFESVDSWHHGALLKLALRAEGVELPAPARPAGVQVWVQDVHHRIFSPEYQVVGLGAQSAKIVGARNGTYAAQIVVGTGNGLSGLKAALQPFQAASGKGGLPAAAARILFPAPHPASEMTQLGENRGRWSDDFINDQTAIIMARYLSNLPEGIHSKLAGAELKKIQFFDHLSPRAPEKIPAGTSQPVWVSVQVPLDAVPGLYRSSVKIEGDGMTPVEVPVELEVLNWRVPEARNFQTVQALEQSPYGVAKQYKVELWSDKHFELMEASFKLIAGVGNNWLNIPLLSYTEFGNMDDSPLRMTRKKDGSWSFDYAILDRYMDLASKYNGAPLVINFVVNHPGHPGDGRFKPAPVEIHALDEKTGKRELISLGSDMPQADRRAFWKTLATGLYAHMKSKGMERSMYWGYPWDGEVDPTLPALLAEFCPSVNWTRGAHGYNPDKTYTAVSTVYGSKIWLGLTSKKGWKRPEIHLYNPRHAGTAMTCFGNATPFAFRLMMDRILTGGGKGVGRIGADYWGPVFLNGFKGTPWIVGMPCNFMLWPGPDGAESSIRLEMLREGIQEVEARIFLEQALEKLSGDEFKELRENVQNVLDRHQADTLFASPGTSLVQMYEYCSGWQTRSRKLYRAASEVAEKIGLDADHAQIELQAPARGQVKRNIKLRNWTAQPRAWTLASDQSWIKPDLAAGKTDGQQEIGFTCDTSTLEAGKDATGALTLTDAASGRAEKIEVQVHVGKVFDLSVAQAVLNVAPGAAGNSEFLLFNSSGAPLIWKSALSAEWSGLTPANGKIEPGNHCVLALKAAPPGKENARQSLTLAISEEGGGKIETAMTVYTVSPYQAPTGLPSGTPTLLEKLPKEAFKAHRDGGRGKAPSYWRPRPDYKFMLGTPPKEVAGGITVQLPQETVIDLKGKNFTAFSAEVGLQSSLMEPSNLTWSSNLCVVYEVYVDGVLRAQSGLMGAKDASRLLAVTGLESASELKLTARQHDDGSQRNVMACWGNASLYSK